VASSATFPAITFLVFSSTGQIALAPYAHVLTAIHLMARLEDFACVQPTQQRILADSDNGFASIQICPLSTPLEKIRSEMLFARR
jgi:hypothetical protein